MTPPNKRSLFINRQVRYFLLHTNTISSSSSSTDMGSSSNEIDYQFPPFIRVYKDGRAERIHISEFVPPSIDPSTGVSSKDVKIGPKTGVSARLYLPKLDNIQKLPLVIYFHGGGFVIESAFSPTYHSYLNLLAAEANAVIISVEYRRAPEHPLPIAYQDSWNAFQWVFSSQSKRNEEWLSKYADYDRVSVAGDSAGANIAHNMAMRAGTSDGSFKIDGAALIHPYFDGVELSGSDPGKFWRTICPLTKGLDDPLINPYKDPKLRRLGCKRLLVCVAERDLLRRKGLLYYEMVGNCGWEGEMELMETQGQPHVFHLFNPSGQKSRDLMNRVVSFIRASQPDA